MKKFLFLLIIIVATVKITLFINKKQTEKLLLEKKTKEAKYTKQELSDMSKAMYNYDYLKYKIKKDLKNDLKERAEIPSSEVEPLYPNKRLDRNRNEDYGNDGYIKNGNNNRRYFNHETSDDDDEDVDDQNIDASNRDTNDNTDEDLEYDENTDNETNGLEPSRESRRKINSLKSLIRNNLYKINSIDNEANENQERDTDLETQIDEAEE